jgi:hypothetical protein
MAPRRRIRRTGRSLAIAIQMNLVDLHEVESGGYAESEPLGKRTSVLRLVKARSESRGAWTLNQQKPVR